MHVRGVIIETKEGLIREEATKASKSRRVIDLDTSTLRELMRYIAQHRARAARWFAVHPEHTHPGEALPLFVGCGVGGSHDGSVLDRLDFSKPMRYSAFNKRHWRRAVKAAGVPPIRFYDLRHADVSRHVDRIGRTAHSLSRRFKSGTATPQPS